MTEIPASLDFLLQGNSCFLEAIGILALLTHQNISLYLSVLQAVQPILSSSNNRQCRQKLKPEPALLMDDLTLHFPAPGHFNQSAGLIEGSVLFAAPPIVSASRISFVGAFPWLV